LAKYPKGRFGPSHDRLPQLVLTYLTELHLIERRKLSAAAKRLYRYRIAADYEPPMLVEREMTRSALRDASFILRSIQNAKH
jgi:hypothetical protein